MKQSKILVVEDAPVDLAFTTTILENAERFFVLSAENGVDALESVEADKPDLVLTDLRMPEMDGLTLVECIRRRFPYVPCVLMTAFGSEELAVKALQSGAASYVSKNVLSSRLVDTISEILEMSRGFQEQEKFRRCWDHTEFRFEIDNDETMIPLLVAHVQQYTARMHGTDETESFRIGVALHEALRNAIQHGNLEMDSELLQVDDGTAYYQLAALRRQQSPFRDRRVHVTVRESSERTEYVIRDDGPGFDRKLLNYDPCDPANLTRPSGRGLTLIHTFVDEVSFNGSGNEITLVSRRTQATTPLEQTSQWTSS